ncbi:MOSC domain-containing protein [Spirosoma oryzicola]|uniref:MOSC domain-containing protein n=1 Tax=Spirosoma oryzicola TaxID=2898794 RepID=UPI0031345274
MPASTHRAVDPAYARYEETLRFADVYPYLLIGQASLDDLNQRSGQPLAMLRFRPNIVVSGSEPYEEETWDRFRIGHQWFYGGESCGRCMITTLDPATGQTGPEPLRTLARYRHQGNKLVFGQYVLAESQPSPAITGSVETPVMLQVGQSIEGLSQRVVAHPQS